MNSVNAKRYVMLSMLMFSLLPLSSLCAELDGLGATLVIGGGGLSGPVKQAFRDAAGLDAKLVIIPSGQENVDSEKEMEEVPPVLPFKPRQ